MKPEMHHMPDEESKEQQMPEHTAHAHEKGPGHQDHEHMGGQSHHAMMVADFRRRFWISLIITIPILLLSPLIQRFLGLAIPLVVAVSTSLSAKNGLLIKDRDAFEQAKNVQAVMFDKTGTLTLGKFAITDIMTLNGMSVKELLKYTAFLEKNSEHPIARGIVAGVEETFPVEGFKAIPGKGAQGRVNGREILAVSPGYLQENHIEIKDERIDKLASQGKTVIFTLVDGHPAGAIALADIIRSESKQAIAELKAIGIRCMMITGDNKYVAKWVAQEIGLDEYFAEVLPDKKAEKVKKSSPGD